ncbi:hypothetical protein HPP92_014236 [Vanilla planifolia]|uniref:RING-type domain-containing protein n=1 Tax=Vanilla planifolia TaxID=51239 RepID=A0A835UW13_VANPL|nr:hypothetical protein HPP92_014236 [Vanilla planifolia]
MEKSYTIAFSMVIKLVRLSPSVEVYEKLSRPDGAGDWMGALDMAMKLYDGHNMGGTFLEILEPYILRDMLGCIPPEIMQALVEHYSSKGWLERVEQCILHIDISSVDFNQVVRLCREHGLYGALIYLFTRGLDDFKAPLEELLQAIQCSSIMDVATIGYRLLVYLKYSFQGLAFPPATLDVLKCAFKDMEPIDDQSVNDQAVVLLSRENHHELENYKPSKRWYKEQQMYFISILDLESDLVNPSEIFDNTDTWPSERDINLLLEFIAYLVANKRAQVSATVLKHILKYLTSSKLAPEYLENKASQKEKQVLSVLKAVSQEIWNFPMFCPLVQKLLTFQSAVIQRIPELVKLSRECTFVLVIDQLGGECQNILSQLHSHPQSLFLFFEDYIEWLAKILELKEAYAVRDVLHASIGLCQRNTNVWTDRSLTLFGFIYLTLSHCMCQIFEVVLYRFSEQLRKLFSDKEVPEWQNNIGNKNVTSSTLVDGDGYLSGMRCSKFPKCANILRRLFSQFIGEVIEGMVGYLPLPVVMSKLLSDNGNQEFGDFKMTILKMLGTYNYERRILDAAKSLIEDDTFYTMGVLKKGASHALAPQNLICCFCGLPLTKGSSSLGIRIFNCGHATHLHCECEDNDQSSPHTAFGCPVCQLKKNPQQRNKFTSSENGLVNNTLQSSGHIRMNSSLQHLHETDVLDKSYRLHQMSRFDMLSNLQKGKALHSETLPQLRLAPPAIYHEKVQKGPVSLSQDVHEATRKKEKTSKRWQIMELKSKGSLSRLPLKSAIFEAVDLQS